MRLVDTATTASGVSRALRRLLWAYTYVMGFYKGGGLFETVVIAPLSTLLAIATLVAGWKAAQPLRFWLRLSLGLFLVTFLLTGLYYVPEQAAIKGAAAAALSDAEIMERANRWVVLNWARFAVAFAIWAMTIHALGLSFRLSAPRSAG